MYPFYEIKKNENHVYFNIFRTNSINFPQHLHSYVEIIYVLEGSLKVGINEKNRLLEKGELAVSFPNDIHSYSTPYSSKAMIALFTPEIINSFFGSKQELTLENPYFTCDEKVYELLELLFEEFRELNNEFVVKGLLYAIFGKLETQFAFQNKKYVYDNTIQLILKYIEGHFTQRLTLDRLAKELGFSKFYISRLFKIKIGYQFNEYINNLRINLAQSLLTETDSSILNIAYECGFDSQRSFNRAFFSLLSQTPTEFRRKSRGTVLLLP
jgi:Transcriptional regulator containing an amidase domain and an AraC-type DNA-binding HTH domain